MEYLLNSKQMKCVDEYSINKIGIPSVVLMERAAYTVSELVKARAFVAYAGCSTGEFTDSAAINVWHAPKVLCVCGRGNNGADGLAVARHLIQAGCEVTVECLGEDSSNCTEEYTIQRKILENMGADIRECVRYEEYDYIVDAVFGVGLSREVTGEYAEAIDRINKAKSDNNRIMVVAVDIASGVNATDGSVMGVAVKADVTVTFGYKKLGMVLNPGAECSGEIVVTDIGFVNVPEEQLGGEYVAYTYELADTAKVPRRAGCVNKGDCGKALIVAGSKDMGGAVFMSAGAAYRSGAGLVKVHTSSNNRELLLRYVPEAVPVTYDADGILASCDMDILKKECQWAECIVAGPGLSQTDTAKELLLCVLHHCHNKNIVIDADGLNMLSADKEQLERCCEIAKNVIITPHIGEMSRLTDMSVADIKKNPIECARAIAKKYGLICVLKDARTVVTDGDRVYINTTGNSGMATAGSGDVLTGVMAGMLTAGFTDVFDGVTMAVNIHACAGDMCKAHMSSRSMKAWDLVEELPQIYKFSEV
ncbi:MAG: NAD(P)H-hydrate dehydratase [Lachnospira sp.]|nr:NAD(P)H-hydrate dehydratase [Lachnospira sp.]